MKLSEFKETYKEKGKYISIVYIPHRGLNNLFQVKEGFVMGLDNNNIMISPDPSNKKEEKIPIKDIFATTYSIPDLGKIIQEEVEFIEDSIDNLVVQIRISSSELKGLITSTVEEYNKKRQVKYEKQFEEYHIL